MGDFIPLRKEKLLFTEFLIQKSLRYLKLQIGIILGDFFLEQKLMTQFKLLGE
jgi:hypothetical protein